MIEDMNIKEVMIFYLQMFDKYEETYITLFDNIRKNYSKYFDLQIEAKTMRFDNIS